MKGKRVSLLILAGLLIMTFSCRQSIQKEAIQTEEPSALKSASSELPEKVVEVIQQYFSGAEIDLVELEKVDGLVLYDIEFKNNRGEIEVAADGTIIDITSIIEWSEVPLAAAEVIKKALQEREASLVRLEKAEVKAEIKEQDGKKAIIKLPQPYQLYEAKFSRDGQRGEIQVDPGGEIVEGLKWEAKSR
ncbi:MAG: hypothetical protein ACUVWQ_00020 [Candidatus Aminicenantales bacterium]